jgi:hypothetical protein
MIPSLSSSASDADRTEQYKGILERISLLIEGSSSGTIGLVNDYPILSL